MSDKAFFDTSVLVCAFDKNEAQKSTIAKRLISEYGCAGNLTLSTQVLLEFYVTVTRMSRSLLSKEAAEDIVSDLAEFPLIQVDKTIIALAMKRHQSGEFSFWDSMIVEAALQSGCDVLFSEDMQDGRKLGALVIRNPFVAAMLHESPSEYSS